MAVRARTRDLDRAERSAGSADIFNDERTEQGFIFSAQRREGVAAAAKKRRTRPRELCAPSRPCEFLIPSRFPRMESFSFSERTNHKMMLGFRIH